MRIDNGSTAAQPGLAPSPDLTIESSWQDWVEMSTKGADARRLMLRRRIRPRGSLRNLVRTAKVFPPRPTRLS